MILHPKDIRSRITPKGDKIIAFSVTDAEYQMYLEHFKKGKRYTIELEEWFPEKTFNQRGFFHAHIRALAEKYHWNFDYTKWFILTEDGIEVTEQEDGEKVSSMLTIQKDLIPNVDSFIKMFARANHIYLRNDVETETEYGFRMFKGISFLDSREMAIVINRLIDRCNDAGVPTISAEEYKRLRG